MRTRFVCWLSVLAIALVALGGCSITRGEPEPDPPTPYTGGPISEAEYVRIVASIRQCMIREGYEVGPVEMRPDGISYGFSITGSVPGDTSAHDDLLECEAQFNLPQAEVAYVNQHSLTGAERERVLAEFVTCMDEAGFPGVTSSDTIQEINERVAATQGSAKFDEGVVCLDQYGGRLYGANR